MATFCCYWKLHYRTSLGYGVGKKEVAGGNNLAAGMMMTEGPGLEMLSGWFLSTY